MLLFKAQAIVNVLARKFKVPTPTVRFKRRIKGKAATSSAYSWHDNIIKLYGWEAEIHDLLHEFAHCVQYHRGGEQHDKLFWWSLVDVITVYHNGNYSESKGGYRWSEEYANGKRFYKQLMQLTPEEVEANIAKSRRKKWRINSKSKRV